MKRSFDNVDDAAKDVVDATQTPIPIQSVATPTETIVAPASSPTASTSIDATMLYGDGDSEISAGDTTVMYPASNVDTSQFEHVEASAEVTKAKRKRSEKLVKATKPPKPTTARGRGRGRGKGRGKTSSHPHSPVQPLIEDGTNDIEIGAIHQPVKSPMEPEKVDMDSSLELTYDELLQLVRFLSFTIFQIIK